MSLIYVELVQQLEVKKKNLDKFEQQLNVKNINPGDSMNENQKKLEEKEDELKDLKADLEYSEALNSTLFVKERESNNELQDARKELIRVLLISFYLIFIHSVILCLNIRFLHLFTKRVWHSLYSD